MFNFLLVYANVDVQRRFFTKFIQPYSISAVKRYTLQLKSMQQRRF